MRILFVLFALSWALLATAQTPDAVAHAPSAGSVSGAAVTGTDPICTALPARLTPPRIEARDPFGAGAMRVASIVPSGRCKPSTATRSPTAKFAVGVPVALVLSMVSPMTATAPEAVALAVTGPTRA